MILILAGELETIVSISIVRAEQEEDGAGGRCLLIGVLSGGD